MNIILVDNVDNEKYEFKSEKEANINLFRWFCDEKHANEKLKEEISELEHDLSVKEELLTLKRAITDFELDENKTVKCKCPHCHEEFAAELPEDVEIVKKLKCDESNVEIKELPKENLKLRTVEDWEEEYMSELEKQHQEDSIRINRLQNTIDTLVERCAILMKKQEL